MSVERYRELEARQTTEAQFQRAVVKTAREYGWEKIYHTQFSVGSNPGYPDLLMLKGARCLIVECKKVGRVPTAAQQAWLDAFALVPGVESFVWRPDMWNEIHGVLGRDFGRGG